MFTVFHLLGDGKELLFLSVLVHWKSHPHLRVFQVNPCGSASLLPCSVSEQWGLWTGPAVWGWGGSPAHCISVNRMGRQELEASVAEFGVSYTSRHFLDCTTLLLATFPQTAQGVRSSSYERRVEYFCLTRALCFSVLVQACSINSL